MKIAQLKYGDRHINLKLPNSADILTTAAMDPLPEPAKAITESLEAPIGSEPLDKLAKGCKSAAIVVSDNTRPVPYKGHAGILSPVVNILKRQGVQDIVIIIACGTHRSMTKNEIAYMLGDVILQEGIKIINHVADDPSMLRVIGSTARNSDVTVNSYYLDADLKILTGLVEPHFMAGFSGGRKAVCPGICGQSVTYGFHSASILLQPNSQSLLLDGNPCHEESLTIAKMAGVDFIINVTIDNQKRITGVFSGDLEKAHITAVDYLCAKSKVELKKEYDIVITHAGDVGVNHYQCAKSAVEASRAVKPNGIIIVLGNLTDPDPVGGKNYKHMLKLLMNVGYKEFIQTIISPDWIFVPEQWQVQMWAKVFEKIGDVKNLKMCSPQLENCGKEIPETNIASYLKCRPGETDLDYAEQMLQQALNKQLEKQPHSSILVLPDGPYAVPVIR